MKKRILTAALLLPALLAALCGCGKQTQVSANADEFVVCVRLDTEDAAICAALDYYISGTFLGGLAMNHADGSALEQDEDIVFRFSADQFPPGTENFNGFSFLIKLSAQPPAAYVEDIANSVGYTETAQCAPFTPAYGNVYAYTVSGSFAEGFTLKQ